MQSVSPERLRGIAADIQIELKRLQRLADDIAFVRGLREYLAFRHVVRHLYGFELDEERLERLVTRYPLVWRQVETDIQRFVAWLEALAEQLSSV